jgi:hypothetical protein
MDSDVDGGEQEARIAALFRDAAAGAPPAAFDAAQVAATSRRITRRRRSAVAGAALAVLAVAGVGVVAGLGGPGDTTVTAASGQAAEQGAAAGSAGKANEAAGAADDAARAAAPEAAAAPDAAGGATGLPLAPPVPDGSVPDGSGPEGLGAAGAVPPIGTPLGPGSGDCADRQDPALRALVEQALPEVAGAREAATTMECRPGGERGVALEVPGGLLTVTYLPPGPVPEPSVSAPTSPTASGGTVVVSSRATRAADPAPFADRLDAVVAYLAPRL